MKHCFLFLFLCIAGCGNESPAPSSIQDAALFQSSVESLLFEVKYLLSQSPPDSMGFLKLVHAENTAQENIVRWERGFREPGQILGLAMMERFGVYTSTENPFPMWPVDHIELEFENDAEAEALCTDTPRDGPGREGRSGYTLYLVHHDYRWWVSGYSFESLPDYDPEQVARLLADSESVFATHLERAKLFAAGLESGRFSNFEEADKGWIEFMISGEWP